MRPRTRRDHNETAIRKALHATGTVTWRLDQPLDLLCLTSGHFWLCEVKDPTKWWRYTPKQEVFFGLMKQLRAPAFMVETIEEALKVREQVARGSHGASS